MSLIAERRRPAIDQRSVIIVLVVLLLGAAVGFGVGYEVKAHRTTTKTVTAPATPAKGTPAKGSGSGTPAGASSSAGIAQFRSCLSSHGVNYPAIPGGEAAFSKQISKPPAGVSQTTYNNAIKACYAASVHSK